jgi:hypothetical protein
MICDGRNSASVGSTVHMGGTVHRVHSKLLFTSSDTISVNPSPPFLIKRLIEGEDGVTVPVCLRER